MLKKSIFASTLIFFFSCSPLEKLSNQVNSDLPAELKNRLYHKDFVGSYIKNPEDVLGKLIYMYRINDTTIVYKSSVLRYPTTLGTLRESANPVLRASGVIEIKNSNEFGLFLSAFNLGTTTDNSDAAEIVIIDNRALSIDGDVIQNYFTQKPVLPKETYTKSTITYQPEIVYYVRGVDITTVSAKTAKSFTNDTKSSGAFFQLNNKYYSAGTQFTFDYKAGLTVDDVTSYVRSGSLNDNIPQKNESISINVQDTLLKKTPKNKIKDLKINSLH